MSYTPANTPQLSSYMVVNNAKESIEFYQKAFGFEFDRAMNDDNGNPLHVSMKKDEALIMFCPEGAFGTNKISPINQSVQMPINLYIYCENADKLYKQAIQAGAKSIVEPQDAFWGDRFFTVLDIDNYEWSFASVIAK